MTRLAVLGSPIAHSLSPALHAAAYRELGLDWTYKAVDVPEGALGAFLDTLDDDWRGLSLTMPLKREVWPMLLGATDPAYDLRSANTVLRRPGGDLEGFNTDVRGIIDALAEHGIRALETAHILGMGATATSALYAAARLGARSAVVTGRRDDDDELRRIAELLGVDLVFRRSGTPAPTAVDLLVNTIPSDLDDDPAVDDAGAFFEVVYDRWPSARAERWLDAGRPVVSGLEMLLHQAVAQVRIFFGGALDTELPDEDRVVAAMRASIGLRDL